MSGRQIWAWIVAGVAACGAQAQPFTISDQAVSLVYDPETHWSARPLVLLTGTEVDPARSPLRMMGWWYRAEGDTREYPLPAPDSQEYANGRIVARWDDLDGKGFTLIERTFVVDNEGPSGNVWSSMEVRNLASVRRRFTLFHYANVDAGGTASRDYATLLAARYIKIRDFAGSVMRYQVMPGMYLDVDRYKVAAPAALLALLDDASVTELDDSGLPIDNASVAVLYQRTIDTYPQSGAGVHHMDVSVSSRLTSDFVRGGHRGTGYPGLLFIGSPTPPRQYHHHRGLKRTAFLNHSWSDSSNPSIYAGTEWLASDDFNGDKVSEYLTRDTATGLVRVGAYPVTGVNPLPSNWVFGSTADFDRDGKADILWRNLTSGRMTVWLMDTGGRCKGALLPTPAEAADATWRLAGTADMNGDGFADLVWQSDVSGTVEIWHMDASFTRTSVTVPAPATPGAQWRLAALGDYGEGTNGVHGTADIVWQNTVSENVVVWHMDGAGVRTSGVFTTPASAGATYRVVGPR